MNPVDAEIRVDRMGDAAPAMPCRDQHLLVPKTEEKRYAPWLGMVVVASFTAGRAWRVGTKIASG